MPFTKLIHTTLMVLFSRLGLAACGSQQGSEAENTAFLAFYFYRLHYYSLQVESFPNPS